MAQTATWHLLLLLIVLRYIFVAGAAWLVWYKIIRKRVSFKKIQLKFPQTKDYVREILCSLSTGTIFATVTYLMLNAPIRQYTQFYTGFGTYGVWYFWLAIPLMFIIHDTYFYWMHRLMHHRKLFKYFHLVHHQSTNPSPWAAFAFHPLEALIEVGIIVLLLMIMPLNRIHLFIFFLVMMAYNVYGHLGWELYGKGFSKSSVGKWVNTSVNHNQHHQYFKGNYGLYFLWWDRWMHTIRDDYDEQYEEVKNRQVAL